MSGLRRRKALRRETPLKRMKAWERESRVRQRDAVKAARAVERAQPKRAKVTRMQWSRAVRPAVHERDSGRCVRCGHGLGGVWECHHRKPRSQGGLDLGSNLIALCGTCHTWAHGNPAASYEAGWMVPGNIDPATWPVRVWTGRDVWLDDEYGYRDQDGVAVA